MSDGNGVFDSICVCVCVCSGVLPCNILDVCFCIVFQKITHIYFFFIVVILIVQQNKGLILLKVCLKRGEWTADSYIIFFFFFCSILTLLALNKF